MTNEKLLEDLLYEAYDLGIYSEVLELSQKYELKKERVDAINQALYELKFNLQIPGK
jgi:hypothetical protein